MNRISLSEELIKTVIKLKGATEFKEEIDLKITKIQVSIFLGEMDFGADEMIIPFSAGGHKGKIVLEDFLAAKTNIEFKFRIVDFNLLKIGIQYFGMLLLSILNLFGFSMVKRKGDKISFDLEEILAGKLPEGLKIELTSLKIDHGIEVVFN